MTKQPEDWLDDVPGDDIEDEDDEIIWVSKSEIKRDAEELKRLGAELVDLGKNASPIPKAVALTAITALKCSATATACCRDIAPRAIRSQAASSLKRTATWSVITLTPSVGQ